MENLAADFIIDFNNPIEAEFELSEGGYDCSFELFASGTVWGGITGTLSDQTDLQAALDLKADKTELNTAIQNEATTRAENDTLLQNNINTLSQTVTANYNALDARITTNTGNISDINTTISGYGNIVTHNVSEFATSVQGALADTALQPNDNISELTNDAGYITSASLPTNYVTTNTAQNISGRKTFLGEKAIYFKQNVSTDKLGFTLYSSNNTELGALEYRPNTINGNALLALNCSQSGSNYVGFRYWSGINIVAPRPTTNGIYYIPVNVTDGTNTVTANNNGTLNISSLLPDVSDMATQTWVTNQGYTTNVGTVTSVNNIQPDANGNVTLTIPDSATWGNITGTLSNQTDLQNALDAKQDVLTAGTDIEIVGYAPTTVSGNGSVSLNNAIADGLISVTLTGGCEQNGTPTPTNPVDIICNNGAIKYSKNIFDKTSNATAGSASRYWEIQVPNGTYTCSTDIPHSGGSANVWFDIQPVFSSNVNPVFASRPRTITVTEGVLYVAVRFGNAYDILMSGERWVQVEQGDTATTYHPYGIYIDGNIETISDGNGNTAIAEYLLSVGDYKDTQELLSGEITRNVGIKVLDGTEPWFYNNSGGNSVLYSSSTINTNVFGVSPYSNKYIGIASASGRTDGNIYIININNSSRLDVVDNRFTNAADWKAYLSEQYYAGNPVIVVYAIGDSTSETAQAQTLTTQKGSNTISITQASINNLPISVNYNASGTAVISFTNETGYTSFSEIKDKLAYYGTCTTGASTQNKIVDCNGFELSEGVSIRIKFTNAQTYNGQPTLNVNNTGAIGIALRSDTEGIRYMWQAGDVIEFTYDGTSWIWERGGVATTTYYGVTKLTSSATTSSASVSLTASSLNSFSRYMVSGAQTYSTSTTYAVGDRVRYQYQTWECTSPTTGTWDENSWTALDPLQIQIDNIVGLPSQTGQSGKFLTTDGTNASWATVTIPTATSDLTNDSGFITSSALTGYEQTSNKVTSISSSSTDTQYPSAKCVYDIVGDIETLLQGV